MGGKPGKESYSSLHTYTTAIATDAELSESDSDKEEAFDDAVPPPVASVSAMQKARANLHLGSHLPMALPNALEQTGHDTQWLRTLIDMYIVYYRSKKPLLEQAINSRNWEALYTVCTDCMGCAAPLYLNQLNAVYVDIICTCRGLLHNRIPKSDLPATEQLLASLVQILDTTFESFARGVDAMMVEADAIVASRTTADRR